MIQKDGCQAMVSQRTENVRFEIITCAVLSFIYYSITKIVDISTLLSIVTNSEILLKFHELLFFFLLTKNEHTFIMSIRTNVLFKDLKFEE